MIIFDLDDTLYKERDWAAGGYRAVESHLQLPGGAALMERALAEHRNPFDALTALWPNLKERIPELLEIYRNHKPEISLSADAEKTLETLSRHEKTGLITDGRSRSQRNKIKALGLHRYMCENAIIISSEIGCGMDCKTGREGFMEMMRRFPEEKRWIYVGDNPAKDFSMKGEEGWTTVMLRDSGNFNIHPQSDAEERADIIIDRLSSLLLLLAKR